MKTVAICNYGLKESDKCVHFINFSLCDNEIPIVLLDVEENFDSLPEDGVLIEINAFSCNYRDKALLFKFNEQCRNQSVYNTYCYMPFGSEFVGRVIKIGDKVALLSVGDRVIPNGAYPYWANGSSGGLPTNCASQRVQLHHQLSLIKVPECMPDEVAASFTIASQTAYSMVRKLNLEAGENVLVTASSSNTSLAVIMALKKLNINVYACSLTNRYEKEIRKLGVNGFILKSSLEKKEEMDAFFKKNGLVGFDAVVDPFFDIYLQKVLGMITVGGKYITCGMYHQSKYYRGEATFSLNLNSLSHCIIRNISIIGNCLGTSEDLQAAILDYQDGLFNIMIDSVYSGTDLLPFLEKTFHSIPRLGKVVYKYEK